LNIWACGRQKVKSKRTASMMQSWAFYNHSRLKMEKVGAKRWVCREGKITRENTDTWDEPWEACERRVCVHQKGERGRGREWSCGMVAEAADSDAFLFRQVNCSCLLVYFLLGNKLTDPQKNGSVKKGEKNFRKSVCLL